MRLNTTHDELTRRAVVYHLFFSLSSLALLGAGFLYAPQSTLPAALGSMLLLSAGALVLWRMVRPLSQIDAQLRKLAVAESANKVEPLPIDVRGGSSFGWNRLVDEFAGARDRTNLNERLSAAVQAQNAQSSDDVLNSLTDGVAVTDDQRRVTFANHAFATLVSAKDEGKKLLGSGLDVLLGDDESVHPLLDQCDSRQRTVVAEIARANGSGQRMLRVARRPFRAGNGQPRSGHVWSVRDVTQQKLADKMRDQFLDSATHELRTPLANIKAYAETLALSDMMEIEQQKEFCNTINTEATRLGRLIDDLLSISSMELGSLSISRQNVEIDRLLHDAAEKVRPSMDQKNVDFETLFPEKLPQVKLDKDKFTAALINLLGNAAKYTPAGGRVALRVKWDDKQLVFDVTDTGVGISPEELPKVFDKFFRSSDERVQGENGTGLGLALAHEIVRLHGGALTVQSELDKGSTFTITLPAG